MMTPPPDIRTRYVVGFMFDLSRTKVALIRKQKPDWQKGLLNGIGGKIEPNESKLFAMKREFFEETSVQSEAWDWEEFAMMVGNDWQVNCFRAFSDDAINSVKTITDETVVVVNVADLHLYKTISNIPWLVHMALDQNMGNPPFFAAITY